LANMGARGKAGKYRLNQGGGGNETEAPRKGKATYVNLGKTEKKARGKKKKSSVNYEICEAFW